MQEIIRTRIELGLEKPVRLLQITDAHITHVYDDELECQVELTPKRVITFRNEGENPPRTTDEYLVEALDLAVELDALPILTGDIYDLHTRANVDKLREYIKGRDLMFTPGGHEFQRICKRTMEEPDGYARKMHDQFAREMPEFDIDFESRIIGGVNIITANNAYDYYSRYTVDRFMTELERGYPIIVFSHDPMDDKLFMLKEPYHPEIKLTAEDYEASHRMRDAILYDKRVVTTFTGHRHNHRDEVFEGKMHYITPGLFKGICRLIEIV